MWKRALVHLVRRDRADDDFRCIICNDVRKPLDDRTFDRSMDLKLLAIATAADRVRSTK